MDTPKAPAKAKAAAKTVAPKAVASKAVAPKAAARKAATAAPKAAAKTGARLKVTQTGSPIRRAPDQRQTLIGLGLNKMNRSRDLEDTPSIRGMIAKVSHMVKVEELA